VPILRLVLHGCSLPACVPPSLYLQCALSSTLPPAPHSKGRGGHRLLLRLWRPYGRRAKLSTPPPPQVLVVWTVPPPQPALLKDKAKGLNAAIEALHESQSQWTIPDPTLRMNMKDAISEDFLPHYRTFIQALKNIAFTKHHEKYIKYRVWTGPRTVRLTVCLSSQRNCLPIYRMSALLHASPQSMQLKPWVCIWGHTHAQRKGCGEFRV
jgi:Exo70 exocyst complex subunit